MAGFLSFLQLIILHSSGCLSTEQRFCTVENARIDDARVYGILKKRLSDFDAFAEAVRAYLWRRNEYPGPPGVGLGYL